MNSLYVYGGYDINAGILSDFLKVDLHDEQAFQWENIQLANNTKPGIFFCYLMGWIKDFQALVADIQQ